MENDTKKIAVNTIIVYSRLFIVTILGLLTSRYVIQILGISDYGLYNVVGGIISIFAVISGSMSSTTIRFLNVEVGKDDGNPNILFNVCNVTHIAIAVLLLVLAESAGIFYINNYLNVDAGKESDAMYVFHISTIVACIGIVNIPFMSMLMVKEKFLYIALIDILNTVFKLLTLLMLKNYDGNTLRAYAVLMSLTTLFSFIAYHMIAYLKWHDIVRWKIVKKIEVYKSVFVYNNYNMLATMSSLARSQGSNILINLFFGTVVNGAYAIARTLQGFVESVMANFDTAAAPRITQYIGAGKLRDSEKIVCSICRYCILMMCLAFFPFMAETEFLLESWLGVVPEYVVVFCHWLLLVILVASTSAGVVRYINASGKIKWFKIQSCFWSLIVLPTSYWGFKNGFPAWSIFTFYVVSDICNRICQLYLMHRLLRFNSIDFVKQAYIRPFMVIAIMSLLVIFYNHLPINSSLLKIVGMLSIFIFTVCCIVLVGLTLKERSALLNYVFGNNKNKGLIH